MALFARGIATAVGLVAPQPPLLVDAMSEADSVLLSIDSGVHVESTTNLIATPTFIALTALITRLTTSVALTIRGLFIAILGTWLS